MKLKLAIKIIVVVECLILTYYCFYTQSLIIKNVFASINVINSLNDVLSFLYVSAILWVLWIVNLIIAVEILSK
jgi:hypothetical protein